MITENIIENKIDLYGYFKADRKGATEGFLGVLSTKENIEKQNGNEKKLRSAMMIVAGGGYEHVSPREQLPVAKRYVERDFACFILRYTPKMPYPTAFFEASMAMVYLRENAESLGIDKHKIAVVGFSAGAHLSASLGIIPNEKTLKNRFLETTSLCEINMDKTVKPNAMVLAYPVITSEIGKSHAGSFKQLENGDNRLMEQLSLEKHVDSNAVPCFIWHTFSDKSVPVFNSLALATAYAQNGVPFSLHIYENGKHGLSVATSEVVAESDIKNVSSDVHGWVDLSINWLKERDF